MRCQDCKEPDCDVDLGLCMDCISKRNTSNNLHQQISTLRQQLRLMESHHQTDLDHLEELCVDLATKDARIKALEAALEQMEESYFQWKAKAEKAEAQVNELELDRDGWKRDSLMWSKALERELDGYYFPKSHRIDAAVVSTRRIIERLKTCTKERDDLFAAAKAHAERDEILIEVAKAASFQKAVLFNAAADVSTQQAATQNLVDAVGKWESLAPKPDAGGAK